jgi:hypothetical protein
LCVAGVYVRRVGVLRRFTIALFVVAVSIPLLASSALADFSDDDPDDTPTSFDIQAVRSISHLRDVYFFGIKFYDPLQWGPRTHVFIYMDSRSGPSYDFLIDASFRGGVKCRLYSRDSFVGPVRVATGPRQVQCSPEKRLLRKTHRIRFKVRAISRAGGEQVNDWAPGGFGNWYPHV